MEPRKHQRGGQDPRGFAAISTEKQQEFARKGGTAAHEQGKAHEWTAEEARANGRKGAQVRRERRLKALNRVPLEIPPISPE